MGIKFRRQHPIGHYIVDFACVEKKLIVELDGDYHDYVLEKDATRQRDLEKEGYAVLRFLNEEVEEDVEAVWLAIAKAIGAAPSPSPPSCCRR